MIMGKGKYTGLRKKLRRQIIFNDRKNDGVFRYLVTAVSEGQSFTLLETAVGQIWASKALKADAADRPARNRAAAYQFPCPALSL